jgi:hypothetical protein
MQTDNWQKLTAESYRDLAKTFPEVFKANVNLPHTGFDRWKVNQLRTWKNIFNN